MYRESSSRRQEVVVTVLFTSHTESHQVVARKSSLRYSLLHIQRVIKSSSRSCHKSSMRDHTQEDVPTKSSRSRIRDHVNSPGSNVKICANMFIGKKSMKGILLMIYCVKCLLMTIIFFSGGPQKI